MSDKTKIEWSDSTWTPIRARVRKDAAAIAQAKGYTSLVQIAAKQAGHVGAQCEKCSEGCDNCYSGIFQARCLPHNGTGLPFDRRSRDLVEYFLDEDVLLQPLKWRKPRKVFVCSQTDLFGEWVPDEWIDRILAVLSVTKNIGQVLTKRADRLPTYFEHARGRITEYAHQYSSGLDIFEEHAIETEWGMLPVSGAFKHWPLPNVWLGVSVENREQRKRIDHLRRTPAAIRFLSLEPLLEDLGELDLSGIGWTIIGGESGPGARPCNVEHIRSIVRQCKAAETKCFVKQVGSKAQSYSCRNEACTHPDCGMENWHLKDNKGGDPAEWPADIRVREFPEAR